MGGAKNCPETPRQKMIGMMYLVLTAMLALNVSADILNGFAMVDKSVRTSITVTDKQSTALYEDFDYLYTQNPTKVKEWLDKAILVREKSNEMYDYIQNFALEMVKLSDKDKTDPALVDIKGKSDTNAPGLYGIQQGHASELKDKIAEYRDFMCEMVASDSMRVENFRLIFSTENGQNTSGEEITWETSLFESMPLAAVVAILRKFQSDVRTAENQTVQYLKAQTDAQDFRVNKIEALVLPTSNYVIRGDKYSAKIVLSAVDSTKIPEIFIGENRLDTTVYTVNCGSTGTFSYSGSLRLMGNDGIPREYPFTSEYTVGEPSATISNVDMNVVYRGIDNNFSVSVPGVSADKVTVTCEGGKITKSGKGYVVRPERDGTIKINVAAEMNGKKVAMGSQEYRVKYLPDPKAFLQYVDQNGMPRTIQDGRLGRRFLKDDKTTLIASYGEDELLKANFKITSFSMVTVVGSADSQGGKLSAAQIRLLDRLEGNDYITFKNIRAVGPDGKTRNLGLIQVQL